MRLPTATPGRLSFRWRTSGRWQEVAATAVGEPVPLAARSEAEFVTEHYWGYTRQRDGGTVEYHVEHPRWRVWSVEAPALDADVAGLYGAPFVHALAGPPRSAFLAEGSPVTVYRPRRLAAAGGHASATRLRATDTRRGLP